MEKEKIYALNLKKGDVIAVIAKKGYPYQSGYSKLHGFVTGIYLGFFENVPEVFLDGEIDGRHDAVFLAPYAEIIRDKSRVKFADSKTDYEIEINGQKYDLSCSAGDADFVNFDIYYIKKIIKLGSLENLLS